MEWPTDISSLSAKLGVPTQYNMGYSTKMTLRQQQ